LPVSESYGPFTVTVSSYTMTDSRHAVLYGNILSRLPFTVRILSGSGYVTDMNYVVLGNGEGKVPVDLVPNHEVAVELQLSSPYTVEQLSTMNVEASVHASATYCLVWWFGCFGPFSYSYSRTFTTAELVALAEAYGLG